MGDQPNTATAVSASRNNDDALLELTGNFVRERVAQVLTEDAVQQIARHEIREKLGVFTLKEAARWLKWKSPIALGRAMVREKIVFDTTDPKKTTISFTELVKFRDIRAARYGRGRSKKIVKLEGNRTA